MESNVPTAMMTITRRPNSGPNTLIDCFLHPASGNYPRFRSSGSPRLVFEPSRPTMVGWRWEPDHDRGELDDLGESPMMRSLDFTYRPSQYRGGRALFPEGQSTYRVEAEIDDQGRTIWFHLPAGGSVHSLAKDLDLDIDWALEIYIRDWLFAYVPDTCEYLVDFGQSDSTDQGFEVVFSNDDSAEDEEYKSMHLKIPKDLLQDPIANGSEDLSEGFNPWNEEQKVKIITFLDPYLPRLLNFFETTANSDREGERYASGRWENGMMPYIPEPYWTQMGEDESSPAPASRALTPDDVSHG